MDTIKLNLRKSPTDAQFSEWPDAPLDEPVEILAEAMRAKFGLPDKQGSDPLIYYFLHKEGKEGQANRPLEGKETFRTAGVQEGHYLTLATRPIAGGS